MLAPALFDEGFLKKLEYLAIVSRKLFSGRLRAERRSRKLGAGIEFADHRDYAPGDDLRYLDWSLFGLTALGFLFCWWARIHLGRLWSLMVTVKDEHRVVDTGPYGIVRHPIYSGVMVSAVATALLRASPLAMIGAVLFSIGFALTAVVEEKFLREQLGAEAYDAYSRRVGMLVPKLG